MDSIQELTSVIAREAADVYHGCGEGYGSNIKGFCDMVAAGIAMAAEWAAVDTCPDYQPNSTQSQFLRKTLPKAIEIINKRNTKM